MLQQVNEEHSKIDVMTNIERSIKIGDIDVVGSCVVHKLNLGMDQPNCRNQTWAAFEKHRLIFKGEMNNTLKSKVFNTCVFLCLLPQ